MKRIRRKIKKLMSRPNKNLKKIKQTMLIFAERALQKKNMSLEQQSSLNPDFCFEEEAAKLAYQRGGDLPANLANRQQISDSEEEITPAPVKDNEIFVRERDEIIEKFERIAGRKKKRAGKPYTRK